MIRRPPRSTRVRSSAASDVYKRQGKGGLAYILHEDYGLNLPRNLQVEFRNIIQEITDEEGKELRAPRIFDEFRRNYVDQPGARLQFVDHQTVTDTENRNLRIIRADLIDGGNPVTIEGRGTGPIDGFVNALGKHLDIKMSVVDYSEHSLKQGADAAAVC